MYSLIVLYLLVASSYAFNFSQDLIDPTAHVRIIGGSNAPDGAYPYQISIRYSNSHRCGGAIVNKNWVITSAYCVAGLSAKNLRIIAGSNKLNSGGDSYQILEVYSHESYNSRTGLNDIAVLKVGTIAFNTKVKKIAVGRNEVPGGVSVILSGWGSTRLGGPTPNDLQHINLKSISVQQCKDDLANSGRPIEETQLCTLTKSGEGACHGDLGSPLITDVNGDRKLVGIATWFQPCARGYPDVFARVSSYVNWLNEKCKCL